MNKPVTPEPVYFHDCPALGEHTRVVKAYFGSKDGSVMYYRQYKCPFCSYTVGGKEYLNNHKEKI